MLKIVVILSMVIGAYMLIDGIFVILNGKYIGPVKPGPWSILFEKLNINVFKLGPLFCLYGAAWIVFSYFLSMNTSWVRIFGVILGLSTLWYLPLGTLISMIVIVMLLHNKISQ